MEQNIFLTLQHNVTIHKSILEIKLIHHCGIKKCKENNFKSFNNDREEEEEKKKDYTPKNNSNKLLTYISILSQHFVVDLYVLDVTTDMTSLKDSSWLLFYHLQWKNSTELPPVEIACIYLHEFCSVIFYLYFFGNQFRLDSLKLII